MTDSIVTSPAENTTNPAQDQAQSASYSFLEAILHKDVVTLRRYGVDDKTTASIDLKTQIDVAQKLLASDNNHKRSLSKRLLAAQAGLPTKQHTNGSTDQTISPTPGKAIFHRSIPTATLKAIK